MMMALRRGLEESLESREEGEGELLPGDLRMLEAVAY